MSVTTRTLVGLVGRYLFFFFTINTRIKERFTFTFKKTHAVRHVVFRASELESATKIAVFAIYPQNAMWNSVVRTHTYLKDAGFVTVFVINRNEYTKQLVANLEGLGVTVIIRANIGHDFGAYQAGLEFLQSENLLDRCERLLLLNDSVIVTPNSEKLISMFFEKTTLWQCLSVSTLPTLHAQSYFLAFSSEVFRAPAFREFWINYYPTSLRNRVIQSGEVGLSRVLISAGFLPDAFMLHIGLNAQALANNELNVAEKIALFSSEGDSANLMDAETDVILNRIYHQLYERNPNQALGLYLARNFGFPLKRNSLCSRLYSLTDVMDCLKSSGIRGAELEELKTLFLSTLIVKPGLLYALWRSIGLVR